MAFYQVRPREEGAGELFGKGLGAGFGESLQNQLGQFFQERQESREMDSLQKQIGGLSPEASLPDRLQAIMGAKASPETKKKFMEIMKLQGASEFAKKFREGKDIGEADLIEGMAMGYIDPGFAQAKIKELQSQKLLDKFFGEKTPGEQEAPLIPGEPKAAPSAMPINTSQPVKTSDQPPPATVPPVTKSGKGWEKYSDSDLTLWKAAGGPLASAADLELKRRDKAKLREFNTLKEDETKRRFGHKETAKYAEDVRAASENAREVKQAVNEITRLSKEGVTGLNFQNAFTKFLQKRGSFLAPAFTNKDAQSLISATKTLAGGFRSLFGSKPTQAEFFWYENILPYLLKDADTNIAAAQYFGKIADHNLKTQDISDEIVQENGGYRPIDLDTQVRKRIKPETDRLVKEGESLYKAAQKPESTKESVRMRDPAGNIRKVSGDDVEKAMQAGYQRIA